MPQPDDFGLDLATRIALHEMLIQKLFAEYIARQPDADAALRTLKTSLVQSFEVDSLNHGAAPLDAAQAAFVREQSRYGKELAERFVGKVAKIISA